MTKIERKKKGNRIYQFKRGKKKKINGTVCD
jgi:hypothetical protein